MAKDEAIYPEFTPDMTMAFARELEHLAVELMLGEDATFEQFFCTRDELPQSAFGVPVWNGECSGPTASSCYGSS